MSDPRWLTLLLGCAVASLAACADDGGQDPGSTVSTTSAGGGTQGGGGAGAMGGGGGGGAGVGGAGGSGGGESCEAELGELSVSDVPDGDCEPRGGPEVALYPGDGSAPVFGTLAAVNSRWVAGRSLGFAGFVTFAADGSGASPALIGLGRAVASEGSTVGEAWLSGAGTPYHDVNYQRYDDTGTPVGSPVVVAADQVVRSGPWIAARADQALVVWAIGGRLRARGIDATGAPAGAFFELGNGSFNQGFVHLSVTARTGGYAIAWSGSPAYGVSSSYFARTTSTALEGEVVELASSCLATHEVIRLVDTPSGYRLLMAASIPPETSVYLLALEPQGAPQGDALKLAGAYVGRDLAAQQDELGVLVTHADAEQRFRPFDAARQPLGPWVCLAPTNGLESRAALAADGAGYAALYWKPGDTEMFARFDHLGTGAP